MYVCMYVCIVHCICVCMSDLPSILSIPVKLYIHIGTDKRVYIWDLEKGSQVCELPGHTDTVYQLAFSRDSTILASGIHTSIYPSIHPSIHPSISVCLSNRWFR